MKRMRLLLGFRPFLMAGQVSSRQLGNRGFVALAGAPGGLLRAPADRLAQAADMARMVRDAEFQTNHGGDPATGPDLAPKAIGFGPSVQQLGQARQLLGDQPAGGPRVGPMPERLGAPVAGPRHPLADGPLADPQGLGDLALSPALLLEVPGLQPSRLFPVVRCRVHAWQSTTGSPTL